MKSDDNKPHALTDAEWNEIAGIQQVREGYGLAPDDHGETLMGVAYGARFDFVSHCFCGDLYVVQDDALGAGPLALIRERDGSLRVLQWD